eukprot:s3377_g2.t1
MSSIDKLRQKKLQRQAQGASSDLKASLGAQPGAGLFVDEELRRPMALLPMGLGAALISEPHSSSPEDPEHPKENPRQNPSPKDFMPDSARDSYLKSSLPPSKRGPDAPTDPAHPLPPPPPFSPYGACPSSAEFFWVDILQNHCSVELGLCSRLRKGGIDVEDVAVRALAPCSGFGMANSGMSNSGPSLATALEATVNFLDPLPEERQVHAKCIQQLETIVKQVGKEWEIQAFGSAMNGFLSRGADLDVSCFKNNNPDRSF